MKKTILIALLLCLVQGVKIQAQDVLTLKDGTNVKAIVKEVNEDNVRYVKFDNQDGPVYTKSISEIQFITYKNGDRDIFEEVLTKDDFQEFTDAYYASMSIWPGMSYKEYKDLYNPRDFHYRDYGDKYSPFGAGLCSFFIPGLGEMINGEVGEGIVKLLCNIVCNLSANSIIESYSNGNTYTEPMLALLCYAGSLYINIASIIDAARMAKIKNLYNRDIRNHITSGIGGNIDIKLVPDLHVYDTAMGHQGTAGLSLNIAF